jgi:dTDP-4-dehydrorhamnose reductase
MAERTGGVLVLGTTGQVGRALVPVLEAAQAVLGPVTALGRDVADLTDETALRRAIAGARPRAVIIAAAHTAVDRAESEPELAARVNAVAPGVIGEAAAAVGACVVHYSTDYVFDGSGTRAWRESDATGPLSTYGRTKLAGEQALAAACQRHVIFRTSWVVSPTGTNFIRTMLRLAAERTELRVVADQVGAPTAAARIASVTAAVLGAMLDAPANDPRWGTYHLAPAGETSWHGLARHVIARARERGVALACAPEAVHAITTAEYPTPAVRPKNSRLDTTRLRSTFALALPDWRVDVDTIVDSLCPVPTA